ncbi:MAG: hypothetical protein AAB548_00030 [Patescibacteria group bacterium]
MTEKLFYRPETKETEPKQQNYFVLSENGFGGQKYRLAKRYLRAAGKTETSWSTAKENDCFITVVTISSAGGKLDKIIARIGNTKIRLATFQPSDEASFNRYLQAKNPAKGKLSINDLQTITASPKKYAVSLVEQKTEKKLEVSLSPTERMRQAIAEMSFFPVQNPETISQRLESAVAGGRPFRIGCFVCLNMKCYPYDNKPVYFVGQEENRLETPRLTKRTIEIVERLEKTGVNFSLEFLLADTDVMDVYGEWLGQQNLPLEIDKYKARLEKNLTTAPESASIKLWSAVQAPYANQYQKNFQLALETVRQLVGQGYVSASTTRRLQYFDNLGLPYSEKIAEICETTARRNIALYAAQGPILNDTYDLLMIADPNPTRLGKIQSLLCPDLPIWYPYPG